MLSEKRRYLLERIKRINFVKTELLRLVGKSVIHNTKVDLKTRVLATANINLDENRKSKSFSIFRFYCMSNLSPKLVNRRYRLSRFSFNKLAHAGKLPGVIKKGW